MGKILSVGSNAIENDIIKEYHRKQGLNLNLE